MSIGSGRTTKILLVAIDATLAGANTVFVINSARVLGYTANLLMDICYEYNYNFEGEERYSKFVIGKGTLKIITISNIDYIHGKDVEVFYDHAVTELRDL